MKFEIICNDVNETRKNYTFGNSNEPYHYDPDFKNIFSENEWDRIVDGFYDNDGNTLCKGEDGKLYLVLFDYVSGNYSDPGIWREAKRKEA